MGVGHSHGHGHHHHHHGPRRAPGSPTGRLWLAFSLNLGFAIIELIGGLLTNSVAIMSDALHDFGDALAIGLALGLERYSQRQSDSEFSYGYRRYSTVAALVTGFILVAGSVFILSEAVPRLLEPQAPHADGMLLLAILGLAVNGFAAWRVSKGVSLSERMIVWHLIEDVMGWALVLIGALMMKFFDMPRIDAVLACILALWILFNVARNLKETFRVFLQGVPLRVDVPHLEEHIGAIEGVRGVHHIHVWSLDGEQHVFTGHVIVEASLSWSQTEEIKRKIKDLLRGHDVSEATIEIEPEGSECVDPTHFPTR